MLEELAKRDQDWRKMAFHICKCHDTADDIVQDMYLKFANYDKKVNDFYIYFAIKSIWLDRLKDKKTKTVELIDNFNIFADTYDFDLDEIKEITLKKVKHLPFFERELLKVTTQEMSQRELSRQTGINLLVIQKTVKKTKEQIWEDVKKLQEREI
jgi:DNA-directed RNA polymerase specialized sigma24 family protein